MNATISKDKSTLIIELPINNPPKESKSGRTLLVATTGGNKGAGIQVNGQELIVGVNAYIYAEAKEGKGKGKGRGAEQAKGAAASEQE